MALLSPEVVSAVRSRLSGKSSKSPDGGGKTETQAAKLKENGNQHFKKKKTLQALQCYSEAITLSPWSHDEECSVLRHLMECLEPSKGKVAEGLVLQQENKMADNSLLAVCFGNRSAALYELGRIEECMADIEWALSLNFPVVSEYKLHRRRACCLAQLGRKLEASEALEISHKKILTCASFSQEKKDQLTKESEVYQQKIECLLKSTRQCDNRTRSKEHILLSSAHRSDYITEDSSPSKGKFLRAARPIEAGETVMAEEPYAAVLDQSFYLTHCSYCFCKTSALIPCCWCSSDLYCSSGCREKGWRSYHWLECSVSSLWSKADWMMRCALRMVISAPASTLYEAVTHRVNASSTTTMVSSGNDLYNSILSLVAHENTFSDVLQKEMLTKMTRTLTECFGESITQYLAAEVAAPSLTTQQMISGLEGLFLHHLLQLRCNSHSVSVVEVECSGTTSSGEAMETRLAEEGLVETTRELKLGSALYPTASLFNHSCWPNVIFRFAGNTVEVVATKPIQKGEEINNCYGPQVGRMKRSDRLAELKKKYFFDCACPACTHMDPSLDYREKVMDAYGCSECGGILEQGTLQWVCSSCGRTVEKSELEDINKLLRETERMLTAAVESSPDVSLSLLLKCHKMQSGVLHEHNMQLARTSDTVAHAYACRGDFYQAVQFCEASCRAVETVHGSHSIELATELHKLALLLFNSRQFSAAAKVVKSVLPVIQLYHPPNHPDVIELIHMKEALSHECS